MLLLGSCARLSPRDSAPSGRARGGAGRGECSTSWAVQCERMFGKIGYNWPIERSSFDTERCLTAGPKEAGIGRRVGQHDPRQPLRPHPADGGRRGVDGDARVPAARPHPAARLRLRVWPGAKHTRFEHSLGVLHLMRLALAHLRASRPARRIERRQTRARPRAAALLHDIGHYPFSPRDRGTGPAGAAARGRSAADHHRARRGRRRCWRASGGSIRRGWRDLIDPAAEPLPDAATGCCAACSRGALDMDKLDYLPRDARACNVPYGGVDTPRLLDALRAAAEVDGAARHRAWTRRGSARCTR